MGLFSRLLGKRKKESFNSLTEEDICIPEKDSWEGIQYSDYEYKVLDRSVELNYRDANGLETTRELTIKNYFFAPDEQDFFVQGFCHMRHENRTFRASRMLRLTDLLTGETAEGGECKNLLLRLYETSPYAEFEKTIKEYDNELVCMIYLARLDGRFTQKEKELIFNSIEELTTNKINEGHRDFFMHHFKISEYSQIKALRAAKNLKKFQPNRAQFLFKKLEALLALSKKVNPVAAAGLVVLSKHLD